MFFMEYFFTLHVKRRINKRNLTEDEIIESIKYADKITKKHGKYYAKKNMGRGIIEIIYKKTGSYIRIITVYWL
jgi:uncharacterized FlaG/YvyC family protein